jgi:hypothetical protein
MARWVAGLDQPLGDGMMLTQDLLNGQCRVRLYLDPQRLSANNHSPAKLPELNVLCKEPGQPVVNSAVQMSWVSADMLEAMIPLTGGQTMMASLDLGPSGHATLPPVCLPYSSEYAPAAGPSGSATLEALARITGGCQRADLATIWGDLPSKPRWTPMKPYLLLLALLLVLAEVLQRRTGLLAPASLWQRLAGAADRARTISAAMLRQMSLANRRPEASKTIPEQSDAQMQGTDGSDDPHRDKAPTSESRTKAAAGKPKPPPRPDSAKRDRPGNDEFLDALSKARKKAQDRTSR